MAKMIYDTTLTIITIILFYASIGLMLKGNYMPSIICALLFIGIRIRER